MNPQPLSPGGGGERPCATPHIWRAFTAAFFFLAFSPFFAGISQSVIVKWIKDTADLAYGDTIKIRPMVPYHAYDSHEPDEILNVMVFDETKKNNFTEPTTNGRKLYARYIDRSQWPPLSMENVIPLLLGSSTNEAILNFTTEKNTVSQLTDFAFGYGLYFLVIEVPTWQCTSPGQPSTPSWSRNIIPLDFRDSNYPYGSGSDILVEFETWVTDIQTCPTGIHFAAKVNGNIIQGIGIPPSTSRDKIFEPVAVYELFNRTPAYDFTVENSLSCGLPGNQMADNIYLTHSANIHGTYFNLIDLGDGSATFMITPQISIAGNHVISNDITITLHGFQQFTYTRSQSSKLGTFCARGFANNRIKFVNAGIAPNNIYGAPSGLVFSSYIIADLTYCDFVLGLPVQHFGVNESELDPLTRLKIDNCSFVATATSADVSAALVPVNCCLSMENVRADIKNSSFTGAWGAGTSSIEPQTGIIAKGACQMSKLTDCMISGLGGHGMEFINLGGARFAEKQFHIKGNTIKNNLMNGALIRDGDSHPYFEDNDFLNNGYIVFSGIQSLKLDGVGVFQAFGRFQDNNFFTNGGYGLHASWASQPAGYEIFDITNQNAIGNNCFSENFYNLGGYYATGQYGIRFGYSDAGSQNFKGDKNTFLNPRDIQGPYQVTLYNYAIAHLKRNRWVNTRFPNNGKWIYYDNTSAVNATDDLAGSTRCFSEVPGVEYPPHDVTDPPYIVYLPHQDIVDDIVDAEWNGDWQTMKEKAFQLLKVNPISPEATIAALTLVNVFIATQTEVGFDEEIIDTLSILAYNRDNEIVSLASGTALIHAWDIAGIHDSSIVFADLLASWYEAGSETWKNAYTHNAYALYDYYNDRVTAKIYLDSLLAHFPDDAHTISAYYSVMGILPYIQLEKKRSVSGQEVIPTSAVLEQCYPNPFNPTTSISFFIPVDDVVSLVVTDAMGREVSKLVNGPRTAGFHNVAFNGNTLPSGAYYYRLTTSASTITRSMVLLK